jgi:hypothetical protein
MRPRLTETGTLLVPRRAESNGVVGDGMVEIGPDDPEYARWVAELERQQQPQESPPPPPEPA